MKTLMVFFTLILCAPFSFAVGPDFSTLTSAVDVTSVATAILAVAALMMAVVVVRWGAKKILSFF